jgi:hypothetical protein
MVSMVPPSCEILKRTDETIDLPKNLRLQILKISQEMLPMRFIKIGLRVSPRRLESLWL